MAGWQQAAVAALAVLVAALSVRVVANLVGRRQLMNASFDPLRLVNTYGAFGAVTRVRREIVLEGTDEAAPGPATAWKEYQFKAKPGDPRRRPRQVAPYHLRLDWLLWFAAMSPPPAHPGWPSWSPPGCSSTTRPPWPARPQPVPRPAARFFVQARLYRYRFTTLAERRRRLRGSRPGGGTCPPLRLDPISGEAAHRPRRLS